MLSRCHLALSYISVAHTGIVPHLSSSARKATVAYPFPSSAFNTSRSGELPSFGSGLAGVPWQVRAAVTALLTGSTLLRTTPRHRGRHPARDRNQTMGLVALCSRRKYAESVKAYFSGKVIWVTGASGGLGEALCVELCRVAEPRGLVLSARREAELERVKGLCLDLRPNVEVLVLPLDLCAVDTLQESAQKAMQTFGLVDVLVNNGGVGFRGVASETSLELDKQVMNIDFFSGVALMKSLLPAWLAAQSGHVVQISSVQGFFGLPGRTAYSAAKHAAVGFYDSLRAEVEDSGISVTTVCPGYIKTGHSLNAVHSSSGGYPEGHTSKGVPPESLAREILVAVSNRRQELVSAALDARLARLLRTLCPQLLFWVMRRRARKEMRERELSPAKPVVKDSKQNKND